MVTTQDATAAIAPPRAQPAGEDDQTTPHGPAGWRRRRLRTVTA